MSLFVLSVWGVLLGIVFSIPNWAHKTAFITMCISMAMIWWVSPPRDTSVNISSPITGRWLVYNSPSTKVPSHRGHGWAQTFAVDFVHDPLDGIRPPFGEGSLFKSATDYAGFGADIHSPINGEVVRVWTWARDHRARDSVPARILMMFEGVRELGGPVAMLGNYIVLRQNSGWYVLLAHLQRGSISVQPSDFVNIGDKLARCGNSGNSSEPHLHIQVMDRASVWTAIGIPFTIDGNKLPESDKYFTAELTSLN